MKKMMILAMMMVMTRQIAQNTNAHHSGSGHFGGRR